MKLQLNPDYEAIFAPVNIDDDCDSIAHKIDVVGLQIKELLKHWCYFDDWYSPDYSMKLIYDAIMKHDIDAESQALLKAGHDEIKKTECYDNYGCPSYID